MRGKFRGTEEKNVKSAIRVQISEAICCIHFRINIAGNILNTFSQHPPCYGL